MILGGPALFRRLRRNRLALAGFLYLGFLATAALVAPLFTSYDPTAVALSESLQPPSWTHWMGTDKFGRDIWGRVLAGAVVSLKVACLAQALSFVLGIVIGGLAGYFGRWVDYLASWAMTVVWSFPFIIFVIAVTAALGPGLTQVYIAVGLANWVGIGRVARAEFLTLREREYALAARALGSGHGRVIFRHILPNALPSIVVTTMLGFADVITAEAALSFLGLGVQPPDASWGEMIRTGAAYMTTAWWQAFFPGLIMVFTIMSFTFIGDGINDAQRT